MKSSKVAISIDTRLLKRLDRLVKSRRFGSRSEAVQIAVTEKISRLEKSRLAAECAKLNKRAERRLADEGLSEDFAEWPDY